MMHIFELFSSVPYILYGAIFKIYSVYFFYILQNSIFTVI